MQLRADGSPVVASLMALRTNAIRPRTLLRLDGADTSTTPVVQAQFTPQTRLYLGYNEEGNELYDPGDPERWKHETIGNVLFERVSNMNYKKTDGSNTGSIKHYVPYNWIMKNIADKITGMTRQAAFFYVEGILGDCGIGAPAGDAFENPAAYDAFMRDAVYAVCDWEENLFRDVPSGGDGGGTKLDIPSNAAVLARVKDAADKLGSLAEKPL